MKSRIIGAGLALLAVLSLIMPAAAAVPGNTVYFNTRQIADNLQYINTVSWDSTDGRGESFVLRYSEGGESYPIVIKDETVYGPVTISDAVSYAERQGKKVLAAFNSDFFSLQTGVPFGIFIEDGVYKSSPEGRNAVSFDSAGGVYISSAPTVSITLDNHGGPGRENNGKMTELSHFNKFRTDTGGLYLFSEHFSSVSTRTATEGWFVRFKILEGTPSVSGTMTLEVTETLTSDGAVEIGEGYLVLSAAVAGGYAEEFEKYAAGDIVTLTTTCSDPELISALYATGGGDMLVVNGVKADTSGWDALLSLRHPRTALGIKADGTVVCYVIDGRDTTQSVGLLPDELSSEMLKQGCVTAINLDGGGSSAMSVRFTGSGASTLVNKPSDGNERKCSTYIMFVTDTFSDGRVKNLALKNDGAIVMSGSSIELIYAAEDSGFNAAAVPSDITASPSNYGASAAGNIYTAGDVAGTDKITLYSPSTGAFGTGNISVITEPTSLTITKKGSLNKLALLQLMPGQSVELDVIATYYRRSVTSQLHSFDFMVTGDIGTLTDGVFTASNIPDAAGTITASAGGTKTELKVELGGFDDMTGHWASEYVTHLAGTGVVKGITDTEYGPELEIRRGDFVLMLYRAAGEPAVGFISSFGDVPSDSYYAGAIAWAKELGVAAGTGDGKFEPDAPLTRQQAFTFVYRTLGILNIIYADGQPGELTRFSDSGDVADYAAVPAATLVSLRVVEGADGMLSPTASFTRAQMAKVLSVILKLPRISGEDDGVVPLEEIIEEPPFDSGGSDGEFIGNEEP